MKSTFIQTLQNLEKLQLDEKLYTNSYQICTFIQLKFCVQWALDNLCKRKTPFELSIISNIY